MSSSVFIPYYEKRITELKGLMSYEKCQANKGQYDKFKKELCVYESGLEQLNKQEKVNAN